MKCLACNLTTPREVTEPNFCFHCGRPLSQYCPYEMENGVTPSAGGIQPTRLPLYSEGGQPTSSCFKCSGLFKSCNTCRRLHKLDAPTCLTPDCQGTLIEPIRAFPTVYGPIDGSRRVEWPGSFVVPTPFDPQNMDRLQTMAFRYGMLVGVGRNSLRTYLWTGRNWEQKNVQPLAQGLDQINVHSLMLEQGKAFLLGDKRTLVYSMAGGLSLAHSENQIYLQQVVGSNWWVRLSQESRLILQTGNSWAGQEIYLSEMSGRPMSLATDSTQVYIGTNRGELLCLDPATTRLETLVQFGEQYEWRRITASGDWIALRGIVARTQTPVLALAHNQGLRTQGPIDLLPGSLSDFTWVGDSLYIARESEPDPTGQRTSAIMIYDTTNLTGGRDTITLDTGARTQPGVLGLINGAGERRLLVQRRTTSSRYVFVNPGTNKQDPVSTYTGEAQIACVADLNLVIARSSPQQTLLDTFPIA